MGRRRHGAVVPRKERGASGAALATGLARGREQLGDVERDGGEVGRDERSGLDALQVAEVVVAISNVLQRGYLS